MRNLQNRRIILVALVASAMLPLQSPADDADDGSFLRLPPLRQEFQSPADGAEKGSFQRSPPLCREFQSPGDGAREGSVRIVGQISPLLSGSAGSGAGAPDYGDAFSEGYGAALEYHRRMSDRFSIVAGIGYDSFDGDTHQGISFDDLGRTSLYGGAKIHFSAERTGWQPYARVDLGAARISSVDVSLGGISGTYWDSSWELLADVGAGIENRFGDWSAFGEVLFRYVGEPDSVLGSASEADGSWSIPIRIGVGYHF